MKIKNAILVGKISKPYGIKGYAKLFSYMEYPESIFNYQVFDYNGDIIKLSFIGTAAKFLICKVNNCDNVNLVSEYSNRNLYIKRDLMKPLSDNNFYIADILGVKVFNKDKLLLGRVVDTHNFGSCDIIEVKFLNNKSRMFEFSKENFPEVSKDYVILDNEKE